MIETGDRLEVRADRWPGNLAVSSWVRCFLWPPGDSILECGEKRIDLEVARNGEDEVLRPPVGVVKAGQGFAIDGCEGARASAALW